MRSWLMPAPSWSRCEGTGFAKMPLRPGAALRLRQPTAKLEEVGYPPFRFLNRNHYR